MKAWARAQFLCLRVDHGTNSSGGDIYSFHPPQPPPKIERRLILNHTCPRAHLVLVTFCFIKMTSVTISSSFKVLELAINPQTFLASAQKRQDPTAPVSPISSLRRPATFSRMKSHGAVLRKYAGVLNYQ